MQVGWMWRGRVMLLVGVSAMGRLASSQTLHVYGPGGPAAPMEECGRMFTARTHVQVQVTAGPEAQWISAASANADLVYGGAEYMLTQIDMDHPGLLQSGTRTELYPRAVGILVRKGNPKGIHSLAELARPGVHLLDTNGAGQLGAWEDLAGREGLIAALQQNIAASVPNSAEAIKLWAARADLDAWLTYVSWQKRYPEQFSVVPLPRERAIYRGTPVAIAARSELKPQALEFLQVLRSPECHVVFRRWGWQ